MQEDAIRNPEKSPEKAQGYGDTVSHMGQLWRRIETLPRLLAEGWRHDLKERGVVSAILTPAGWSVAAPVYEVIAGSYMGDVGLYVLDVQYAEALAALGIVEGDMIQEELDL